MPQLVISPYSSTALSRSANHSSTAISMVVSSREVLPLPHWIRRRCFGCGSDRGEEGPSPPTTRTDTAPEAQGVVPATTHRRRRNKERVIVINFRSGGEVKEVRTGKGKNMILRVSRCVVYVLLMRRFLWNNFSRTVGGLSEF